MDFYVISGITVLLVVLHLFRLPLLLWLFIWPAAVYCYIRYGITTLVPSSVLELFLSLTIVGTIAYVITDEGQFNTVKGQLLSFIVKRKYTPLLYLVTVLIPGGVAGKIYLDMSAQVRVPTFSRTVHPAPPGEITFKGKKINLITAKNPYRELENKEPEKFRGHVQNGKKVYYENCVFCHGDDLAGNGMFAHGFTPVPANFNSPTTIAMLQEAYLFWRIAKGGPGLPEEAGAWDSSMPAWEKFLSEEEIWDVILFLYDYVGYKPRAEEEGH